jgi:hypothetical protein
MKRVLLALGTAVLFLGTLVTPTTVKADGGSQNGKGCGTTLCKPHSGM